MNLIAFQLKQKWSRNSLSLVILIAFSMVMIACGGSGGSGGNSSGASYTGERAQALITSENSATLVNDSFEGAITSDNMVPFAVASSDTQDGKIPMPLKLQTAFAGSLTRVLDAPGTVSSDQRGAKASSTETISGDCGGTASFSISADENSGLFSGNFSYSSYCDGGVTMSGSATFSGRLVTTANTYDIDYFSFAFSNLTTTVNGLSSSINGTLECDFQGSDMLITADLVVADSATSLVCWLNNYTVQVSGNSMEISGRYYDQDHGYIEFATAAPLIFSGADTYPSDGLVEFTGAAGINGQPTSAHLRAISSTQCQVTADFDGDGDMEYDSGVILWSEL